MTELARDGVAAGPRDDKEAGKACNCVTGKEKFDFVRFFPCPTP
jgi:hypothetical protein